MFSLNKKNDSAGICVLSLFLILKLTRSYSGGKGSILSSFRSALANSKARNGSSYSLNSNLSVQGQKNGISLSLNDINDGTAEDPKKEVRIYDFSLVVVCCFLFFDS